MYFELPWINQHYATKAEQFFNLAIYFKWMLYSMPSIFSQAILIHHMALNLH